ncbi:uncharacterized protein LOC102807114 isoform X3 [Saccoglossus kowalevskii]
MPVKYHNVRNSGVSSKVGGKTRTMKSGYVRNLVAKVNAADKKPVRSTSFRKSTAKKLRGPPDFDTITSPKSSEFYKRVKQLQEKEKESSGMLTSHHQSDFSSRPSGYGVKMRLKKTERSPSYRPKSWHHSHEGHQQDPEFKIKQKQHEEYRRGFHTVEDQPQSGHWNGRDSFRSSMRSNTSRSMSSLNSFKGGSTSSYRQPGFVKQKAIEYNDMSGKTNSYRLPAKDAGSREVHESNRDFEKVQRDEYYYSKHLPGKQFNDVKRDSDSRIPDKVKLGNNHKFASVIETRAIPVQLVHAQSVDSGKQAQRHHRAEVSKDLNVGVKGPSDIKGRVQSPQKVMWEQSGDRVESENQPKLKRTELTCMISPDIRHPKPDEPIFKYPDQNSSPVNQGYTNERPPPLPPKKEVSPPIPPQRDSSMKAVHKCHKSPTWPAIVQSKVVIAPQADTVHLRSNTWNNDTSPQHEWPEHQGYKAHIKTLPLDDDSDTKTFASQAFLEKEPKPYTDSSPKTLYHPVHLTASGSYVINGKQHKYPPSSKFELHTATVYHVAMDEPLLAEKLEHGDAKYTKPYDYTAKYDVPSPPTRDIPFEKQNLKAEMVNNSHSTPSNLDKSPERFWSPESMNNSIKSTGSQHDTSLNQYASYLEQNLTEQGYSVQPHSLPNSSVSEEVKRLSGKCQSPEALHKVNSIPNPSREYHPTENRLVYDLHSPSEREVATINGTHEGPPVEKMSGTGPHERKPGEDRWHLDKTPVSTARTWKSPGDFQVTPGMGTKMSKRHAISPTEETVKRFEDLSNDKKYPPDLVPENKMANPRKQSSDKMAFVELKVEADTNKEEEDIKLKSPPLRKSSPFTKLIEQPSKGSPGRPSIFDIESENPFRRNYHTHSSSYDIFNPESLETEKNNEQFMSKMQRNSQTPFSDKYKRGEPIELQKEKKEREKQEHLKRQNLKNEGKDADSHSIMSQLQKEHRQTHEGFAKVKDLSSKAKTREDFNKEAKNPEISNKNNVRRSEFFNKHSGKSPPNVQDKLSPNADVGFGKFDRNSPKSATMPARSASAEVNKWYDHVKADDSNPARPISYAYDPTSPSRVFPGVQQDDVKPLSDIEENPGQNRPKEKRRLSDPRRRSDPKRKSDPKKHSDPEKMFHKSLEIDTSNHERQHRNSDPYKEEYRNRQRLSDPKKERNLSDPKRRHRGSDPKMEKPDHRYTKSDSDQYQKIATGDQRHKHSDPTSHMKRRQPSDPEERRKVKEALFLFYSQKTGKSESAESTSSLASSCKLPSYSDRNRPVNMIHGMSEQPIPPKKSYSTSSFRRGSVENSVPMMQRANSEVLRPSSMPPNAYSSNEIKRQGSLASLASHRDSTNSLSSQRDRPSSGGSPPGSLAGSKQKSPHQSQSSILGFAAQQHHRHQSSNSLDKTASLPMYGRVPRVPTVSTKDIYQLYASRGSQQSLKTEPVTPKPMLAIHPMVPAQDKATTLPQQKPRSGDLQKQKSPVSSWSPNLDRDSLPRKSSETYQKAAFAQTLPSPLQVVTTPNKVHRAELVTLVQPMSSDSDSDSGSHYEDEKLPEMRRISDGEVFKFPPSAPEENTSPNWDSVRDSERPQPEISPKHLWNLPGKSSKHRKKTKEKNNFDNRYLTSDSFILPTPPSSPSEDELEIVNIEFPPPPPLELLMNGALDDSAIKRLSTAEPAPTTLVSSTSEDNILDKVEKEMMKHPQSVVLPSEVNSYGAYINQKHGSRGPFGRYMSSPRSTSSLPTGTSPPPSNTGKRSPDKQMSPENTVSPGRRTSPGIEKIILKSVSPKSHESKVTSPPSKVDRSPVGIKSPNILSTKLSLEKSTSPKYPPTSPLGKKPTEMKPAPKPGRSIVSRYSSSVSEIKRKYESQEKGGQQSHTPPPFMQKTPPMNSPAESITEEAADRVDAAIVLSPAVEKPSASPQSEKPQIKHLESVKPETKQVELKEVEKPKEKSPEELKTEELATDIISKSNDKDLQHILRPTQKTTSDYMAGLFPKGNNGSQSKRKRSVSRMNGEKPQEIKPSPREDLSLLLSYLKLSAPKAQLLNQALLSEDNGEVPADSEELNKKKEELLDSIKKKLDGLRAEKEEINEEIHANKELGEIVTEQAKSVCTPAEFGKFELFVNELDSIINLLLSLSGRLARAENVYNSLDEDCIPEQKIQLQEKIDKLRTQHEEATKLKEGIDKRQNQVSNTLIGYLNKEDFADFLHFVSMKTDLTMTSRQIDDKIRLGEEQLQALKESMQQCDKLMKPL